MSNRNPPSDLRSLIEEHDAAALALETAAITAAAGGITSAVALAIAAARRHWLRAFGDLKTRQRGSDVNQITGELADALRRIRVDPGTAILDYAARARTLGIRQGFTEAGASPVDLGGVLDLGTHTTVSNAVQAARDSLAQTAQITDSTTAGSWATIEALASTAHRAGSGIKRATTTVFNDELNGGITAAANHLGAQRVWIAERDACVHCLALSGSIVDVGEPFDLSATFGTKPLAWEPISAGGLTGPPRHPNCRCRCAPWLGQADDTTLPFPDALRREAERSILRGIKLPSESELTRLTAADRLLHTVTRTSRAPSGWAVPKTVKTRAERAIRRGTFTAP